MPPPATAVSPRLSVPKPRTESERGIVAAMRQRYMHKARQDTIKHRYLAASGFPGNSHATGNANHAWPPGAREAGAPVDSTQMKEIALRFGQLGAFSLALQNG